MSAAHLVPCPQCGLAVRAELRMAGQEIRCAGCQHQFLAPKLRDLKQLPPDGSEAAPAPVAGRRVARRFPWSALFAAGLGVALVAGGTGFALWRYAVSISPPSLEFLHAQDQARLDAATPNQLYRYWTELYEERLMPEWKESRLRAAARQGEILGTMATGLLALAGVGAATALVAAPGAIRRRRTR